MSVTFSIPGVSKPKINFSYVCPGCNARYGNFGDLQCKTCGGYAMDPNDDPFGDFTLNVCYENVNMVLYDLLNYDATEVNNVSGSLDPLDVILRLTTAEIRVMDLVKPAYHDYIVNIDENGVGPGLEIVGTEVDEERVTRYIETLRSIAEKAIEIGTDISYA